MRNYSEKKKSLRVISGHFDMPLLSDKMIET